MKRRVGVIIAVTAVLAAGAALTYNLYFSPAPDPPVPADLATADRAFVQLAQRAIDDVRAQPRDPDRWLTLGMVYESHQLMQLALQCYAASASLGGGARATYHLAVLRGRIGDVPAAIDAMRTTIDLDDSHGPAHWRLGFWLLDQNKLDEAEAAFRDAMSHRIGPFDLAGEIGMARVHVHRGKLDRAHAILQPLAARPSPYAAYASHLLGTVLARKERPDEAKVALARGRASEPVFADPLHEKINEFRTDPEWIVTQAKDMVTRGEFDGAIAMLEAARNERPDDAVIQNNLAIALIGARRFDEAESILKLVLRGAPGSSQGHFNLALAAHARAALSGAADAAALQTEAMSHLDEALRLNPSFGGALGFKAEILREDGGHEAALELYFQALAVEPTSGMWWRGAVQSAAACGRFADAHRCIEQLNALRPGDPQIAALMSEVHSMERAAQSANNARRPDRTRDVGP